MSPKKQLDVRPTGTWSLCPFTVRWTVITIHFHGNVCTKGSVEQLKRFHQCSECKMDRQTDLRGTDSVTLPGAPPLARLKMTRVGVRVAWSEDRVFIHWSPSVHVLVMSQDVISSISEWLHTSWSVLVILQWVISRGYFLMICIAAVLLRIYCIDV